MSDRVTDVLHETRCVSAPETQEAYKRLAESKVHGEKMPCMRDDCDDCAPLNALIDVRGSECEARGCKLQRCVYDVP